MFSFRICTWSPVSSLYLGIFPSWQRTELPQGSCLSLPPGSHCIPSEPLWICWCPVLSPFPAPGMFLSKMFLSLIMHVWLLNRFFKNYMILWMVRTSAAPRRHMMTTLLAFRSQKSSPDPSMSVSSCMMSSHQTWSSPLIITHHTVLQ